MHKRIYLIVVMTVRKSAQFVHESVFPFRYGNSTAYAQ